MYMTEEGHVKTLHPREAQMAERTAIELVTGGFIVSGIAGFAAVVLSIIGLARGQFIAASGGFSTLALCVSTICVGAALLFENMAVRSRHNALRSQSEEPGWGMMTLEGGIAGGIIGGMTSVVLGILAVAGVTPLTLVSAAAVVLGGSLIMTAGVTRRLDFHIIEKLGLSERERTTACTNAYASSGLRVLVGVGTVTLGILGLCAIQPQILVSVCMLVLGATLFMGAVSARVLNLVHLWRTNPA
jgi:hypothetical protein